MYEQTLIIKLSIHFNKQFICYKNEFLHSESKRTTIPKNFFVYNVFISWITKLL